MKDELFDCLAFKIEAPGYMISRSATEALASADLFDANRQEPTLLGYARFIETAEARIVGWRKRLVEHDATVSQWIAGVATVNAESPRDAIRDIAARSAALDYEYGRALGAIAHLEKLISKAAEAGNERVRLD